MRSRLPPYVYAERTRHGKRVLYFRIGKGRRVRLPDFDAEGFHDAYNAALSGDTSEVRPGRYAPYTLEWLVARYCASHGFREHLEPVTQRRRRSILEAMTATSGKVKIAQISERMIIEGRERRATGKGHAANAYLKAIKPMFAYARQMGWIDVDPARNVDRVKIADTGGHHVWTLEEVARFEKRHPLGTMANLALRILLFIGPRAQDAHRLGPQHVRNGHIEFRPRKTRKNSRIVVVLPILPPLQKALDATRTGEMAFLISSRNLPFASAKGFSNWFADRCIEADVPGRAHGLRKAGATIAANNGASAHELMAMYGWTTIAQAEVYTRSADRSKLGESGSGKLVIGLKS